MESDYFADKPEVQIIIPTYRALGFVKKAVESIVQWTVWPYRLWIADDWSNQPEMNTYYDHLTNRQMVHQVVRATRRRGFGDLCNWTVNQIVEGDYICLFNSDVEAMPGWLTAMMERMMSDDKIGIVGAKLIYPREKGDNLGGTIQHIGVARGADGMPYHPFRGIPASSPQARVSREVNAVTGAVLLIRRQCWKDLRGFDRAYEFAQFEDVDFCWRARKKDWKIWLEARAVLYHYEHGSGDNYVMQRHDKNRATLAARWKGIPSDEYLFGIGDPPCSV